MMREAIDARGMSDLVAKSGEAALENVVAELAGGEPHFDPLMSMNSHWSSEALRYGGLYLMGLNEDGSNDGHYCPICEFETHYENFDAGSAIGTVADQLQKYAVEKNLIRRH